VPPDVPHRNANVGEATARMLTLFTPATVMQRFFAAMDALGTREGGPLAPGTPEYLAASGAGAGARAATGRAAGHGEAGEVRRFAKAA